MIYINNKEKLNKLKQITNYYIITDFDHTLTTGNSEPSMGIVPQYVGGELLSKRTKIYKHYRPLELDYAIEPNEKKKIMRQWARESFTLLSEYVTKEVVNKSLENANIHLRNGAKEFLQEMNNENILVIIMSAGIGNVIEGFLKKENCLFKNIVIVSNFFEFTNEKTYIDLDNIMATSNKEYNRIPINIRDIIQNKKSAILFGDIIEDIKMVEKNNIQNTLTFGFLDDNIDKNLENYKNKFDIVLTNGETFNTVKDILKGGKNGGKMVYSRCKRNNICT